MGSLNLYYFHTTHSSNSIPLSPSPATGTSFSFSPRNYPAHYQMMLTAKYARARLTNIKCSFVTRTYLTQDGIWTAFSHFSPPSQLVFGNAPYVPPTHFPLGLSFLQLLLQNSSNVHTRTEHGEPLVIAFMKYRKADCVLELLRRGADKNATDSHGTSLIRVAVNCRSFDVVYYLLDNGVGVNTFDRSHETLLSSAMHMSHQWPGYDVFIEILRARGALESCFVDWAVPPMLHFQDDFVFPLAAKLDPIVHPYDAHNP